MNSSTARFCVAAFVLVLALAAPIVAQDYRGKVQGLIEEINRKWPFERKTEIRLP